MPTVGTGKTKKKFSYNKKGKAEAKAYAKTIKKKVKTKKKPAKSYTV